MRGGSTQHGAIPIQAVRRLRGATNSPSASSSSCDWTVALMSCRSSASASRTLRAHGVENVTQFVQVQPQWVLSISAHDWGGRHPRNQNPLSYGTCKVAPQAGLGRLRLCIPTTCQNMPGTIDIGAVGVNTIILSAPTPKDSASSLQPVLAANIYAKHQSVPSKVGLAYACTHKS